MPEKISDRTGDITAEVTYFRTYGIHTVDAEDPVHIFSFPDWAELSTALEMDMPDSGTVLTTEHATFPLPQNQIPNNEDLIAERVESVVASSKNTDAEILLGTPTKDDKSQKWYNSVLHIRGGEVVDKTDKRDLSLYERGVGLMRPGDRGVRKMTHGRMVMICSELIDPQSFVGQSSKPETILAPSCWAVPTPGFSRSRAKAGDTDTYFRSILDRSVLGTMKVMPSVERVIVADRNVPISGCDGPFNAVYDISTERKKSYLVHEVLADYILTQKWPEDYEMPEILISETIKRALKLVDFEKLDEDQKTRYLKLQVAAASPISDDAIQIYKYKP